MDRFTYTWRDFALALRAATGVRPVLLGLLLLSTVGGAAGGVLWLAGLLPASDAPAGLGWPVRAAAAVGLGLVGWFVGAWLWIALLRGAALEVCRDDGGRLRDIRAYSTAYFVPAALGPIPATVLPALTVAGVLGWVSLGYVAGAGPVLLFVLGVPAGMLALLAAVTIPLNAAALLLQAPSLAMHGGDTYESWSRVSGILTGSPVRGLGVASVGVGWLLGASLLALAWTACALAVLWCCVACVLSPSGAGDVLSTALAPLGTGGLIDALGLPQHSSLSGTVASALAVSVWASLLLTAGWLIAVVAGLLVVAYGLLRHKVDGTPITELHLPVEAFALHATEMERREAVAALTKGSTSPVTEPTSETGRGTTDAG